MKTIVIVDDSVELIRLYQIFLRGEGYDVHVARSGKTALTLFEKLSTIDLLLVDCLMPEMSGVEFLSEMKRQTPELFEKATIVGMSGLDSKSVDRQKMEGLVDRMVEKLSDLDSLKVLISEMVESPSHEV